MALTGSRFPVAGKTELDESGRGGKERVPGLLATYPEELRLRLGPRQHLITAGVIPWTVAGLLWICKACALSFAAAAPRRCPEGDHELLLGAVAPVHTDLTPLAQPIACWRAATLLLRRYGTDGGSAHYFRLLAIADFLEIAAPELERYGLVTPTPPGLLLNAHLVCVLTKGRYGDDPGAPFEVSRVRAAVEGSMAQAERLAHLTRDVLYERLVERDHVRALRLLRAGLAWDVAGYDDALAHLADVRAYPDDHRAFLARVRQADPGLSGDWASLETEMFSRYGAELGLAHSYRLRAIVRFLAESRRRLMDAGLLRVSPADEHRWDPHLVESLCLTRPVVASDGSVTFVVDDVLATMCALRARAVSPLH